MSFREIIAELPNLTEDEKRELFGLLAQELSRDEESPEFLAMLQARMDEADRGGRRYTLAETREAVPRLFLSSMALKYGRNAGIKN